LSKSLELETTFHRAFDVVSNPFKTLHQLIELGFDRILTSGQQQKAILGLELIKKLVQQSNGRIEIMAGSGIDTSNAKTFIKAGINNLHCTARKRIDRLDEFGMGVQHKPDQQKIENILQVLAT
jgi:copper homeostasis protein